MNPYIVEEENEIAEESKTVLVLMTHERLWQWGILKKTMSWGNCPTCFRACWPGVQCTKCLYMAETKGIAFWVYCEGHKYYINGVFLELILCPTMRGSLDILSHDVSIRPAVKDEDESSRFIC